MHGSDSKVGASGDLQRAGVAEETGIPASEVITETPVHHLSPYLKERMGSGLGVRVQSLPKVPVSTGSDSKVGAGADGDPLRYQLMDLAPTC